MNLLRAVLNSKNQCAILKQIVNRLDCVQNHPIGLQRLKRTWRRDVSASGLKQPIYKHVYCKFRGGCIRMLMATACFRWAVEVHVRERRDITLI
jgi:hypothetical protein